MKKAFEWSKVLTVLFLVPYITVFILGLSLVIYLAICEQFEPCVTAIIALFSYVAAPIAVVTAFYFWKAKAENLQKIACNLKKKEVSDEIAEKIIDTNEIGGQLS